MDKNLLKALRSGHPEAFKTLVEEHQAQVINTCYGFLRNREDAEDTAQEVFIEIYNSIAGFREEAKLSTWIYRIAVTKSLDVMRKRKRKKRFAQVQRLSGFENQEEEPSAPASSNPETNLENQERSRILHQAVSSLPENQKAAITLSKYEGYSYKEIADIMGTTVSSVESLIHRAKKNLHKRLYQYYEELL